MAHINLPVSLTSFVGRRRELAEVSQLLSSARLVTLTGASGCGKTRLALQVAHAAGGAFADGVWLAELAVLRDPALTPDLVAQNLGVRPLPSQRLLDALLDFVRPRRMLLVLDNCEHLIAACAELTQTLLSAAPGLTILATSREPLALAGEMLYQVSPLSLPPGVNTIPEPLTRPSALTPQDVSGSEAIQLFVERARAVLPDFALTSVNTAAIVNICRRLDGIPLAIELASARANVLTVHQIAARLDDRFAFLISGQRTMHVPHHQTMRVAITWSYALLTAEEQVLLRRLAVFAAGFTLDTVAGICGDDGVAPCGAEGRTLDLLSSLVSKSLVIANTLERTEARYRMLESIRDYALEKMSQAGETARLRDRHLDLFLARAEEAAPRLGDVYQQLWLAWLEGEHDNLRAALAWSLEGGRVEAGLRIANALIRFWEIRGHVQEGLAWFERLLAHADGEVAVAIRVNAYTFASFMEMFLGHASASTAYARAAVDLAESAGAGDPAILTFALAGLATAAQTAGDNQTAFSVMGRIIPFYREFGPPFHLGMGLLSQGGTAIELGEYATAHALLEESLALAREAGDAFRAGHALNSLGDLARCEQNYAAAKTSYEESVALLREVGAHHDLASALGNLGHVCLHLDDVERARALFGESMAAHQAQQNRLGMAEALVGFAAIAIAGGLPAAGTRLLAASAAIGGPRVTAVWPATRNEYTHNLSLAAASLTAAERQAEETAGRVLSLDQAVDYAQHLPLKPGSILTARSGPDDLTEREREVAALIARGRSNGEIAAELVLSKRTVEKHISSILSKLQMTSRAHIVRWAIEKGLTRAAA
jgi:predicted ATPase/DNA-binding CsgD family transcriptional regulator